MSDRAGTPDQTPDPKAEQLDPEALDQISGGAVDSFMNIGTGAQEGTHTGWIEINSFDTKVP
jgi:hypothetical protein